MIRKNRLFSILTSVLAVLFTLGTIAAANPGEKKSLQQINPEDFVNQIDNKFFPLDPGTTFIYEGESEGVPTREEVEVTHQTKEILGVDTTVVHVRSFEEDVQVEDTFDWYAQDEEGNVWYFGEDTKELDENGNVISTEGSWEAGANGAEAGIIMLADPKKGTKYQQELAEDIAEDMAQVTGFEESMCVPYGCFNHVLATKEWSPIEKGVVENKFYAEGVGNISSVMVKGGDEHLELVEVH